MLSADDLDIPAELDAEDIKDSVQWISAGVAWLDKSKEVAAEAAAIAAGLTSPQRAVARHGEDYYSVIDEIAEAQRYQREQGVSIAIGQPGQTITSTEEKEDGNSVI